MALESVKGLFKKSDALLMGVCVLFAALFFVLAASNAASTGNFFTIDSLFFTTVCLLLALTFIAIPTLSLHERGVLKDAFGVPEGVSPARRHEGEIHFEGSTNLFFYVLGALLVLTLVEVVFAYVQFDLLIMLTLPDRAVSRQGGSHHRVLYAPQIRAHEPCPLARAGACRLHLSPLHFLPRRHPLARTSRNATGHVGAGSPGGGGALKSWR